MAWFTTPQWSKPDVTAAWKAGVMMDRKEILQIAIFIVGMVCVAAVWLWFVAPSSFGVR